MLLRFGEPLETIVAAIYIFGSGSLWNQFGLLFTMFFAFDGFATRRLHSVILGTNMQISISIEVGL